MLSSQTSLSLQEGDSVRVFSQSASTWVDAQVVKCEEGNYVHVLYQIGDQQFAKSLHAYSDELFVPRLSYDIIPYDKISTPVHDLFSDGEEYDPEKAAVLGLKRARQKKEAWTSPRFTCTSRAVAAVYDDFSGGNEAVACARTGHEACCSESELNREARLIKHGWDVAQTLQGKDVVLVIGAAGVGKSTLSKHLAAWHIMQRKEKNLCPDECHTWQGKDWMGDLLVDGRDAGETLIPKTYEIGKLIFCDCPCFIETGDRANVANTLNVMALFRKARSVRVVALLDYRALSLERGSRVRELLKLLARLKLVEYPAVLIGITFAPPECTLKDINEIVQKIKGFDRSEAKMLESLHADWTCRLFLYSPNTNKYRSEHGWLSEDTILKKVSSMDFIPRDQAAEVQIPLRVQDNIRLKAIMKTLGETALKYTRMNEFRHAAKCFSCLLFLKFALGCSALTELVYEQEERLSEYISQVCERFVCNCESPLEEARSALKLLNCCKDAFSSECKYAFVVKRMQRSVDMIECALADRERIAKLRKKERIRQGENRRDVLEAANLLGEKLFESTSKWAKVGMVTSDSDHFRQEATLRSIYEFDLQNLTFGPYFNESLEGIVLPSRLHSLTFGPNFNQSMEKVALPIGLQSLTFGRAFNRSMEKVALPDGLQSLTFGVNFCQCMEKVSLPSCLQNLTFGVRFLHRMDKVTLPSSLINLTFGDYFDQSMVGVLLPGGLRSLTFGKDFNQDMQGVVLPVGLVSLTFGECFNQSLQHVALPHSLKNLTISQRYSHNLDNVAKPIGCQVFRV